MNSRRILFVVTHSLTADLLLRGQLAYLADLGWNVGLVSSPGPRLEAVAAREGCRIFEVPMSREIAPLSDVVALLRLIRAVRRFGPDLLVASTPKAGLLGTLAGALTGTRRRLYVLRGLRAETMSGWRRRLLLATERTAARLATDVACVSQSLRRRLGDLAVVDPERVEVPGQGASKGVDTVRFRPLVPSGPDESRRVIGFVGRFTRDKGMADLLAAFDRLLEARLDVRLLLVGDFESGDPLPPAVRERIASDPRIETTGFVTDPAPLYQRMTVLAFPSYREGFPNVPLEAAASAIPTVGYATTGTVDAVVDGKTGTLVPLADTAALADALGRYLAQPELARAHGLAGRTRAKRTFGTDQVWANWAAYYAEVAE